MLTTKIILRRFLIVLSASVLLFGCNDDSKMTGSISGTLIDVVTNAPISSANLTITNLNLSTLSDIDGTFGFQNVPMGTYNLIVSSEGYPEAKKAVTILEGQTTEVEFSMSKNLPKITPDAVALSNNKQSMSIELENEGDGQLELSFTPSQSWITLDQIQMSLLASEKKELNISVDFTDLAFGTYEEAVDVAFDGYSLTIPVTINNVEQADIIWQNWYLSVPIDNGSGKATSIFYEDIINDNLTQEEKEYFYYDEISGSYVLWTRFTGYTTSGTYPLDGNAYCRTELREFWQGNQSTNDNWFMNPGETHIMESTLNVDYVEGSRGRTFIAQIHGKESTNPSITNGPATVKVLWENGYIEVEYYIKPPDPTGEWTSDYNAKSARIKVDNEVFTIKLRVVNGVLSWALICDAKGVNNDYVDLFDYAGNGYHYDNYFKTGNYFQWKSDYEKSAQVRLYKVLTHHE